MSTNDILLNFTFVSLLLADYDGWIRCKILIIHQIRGFIRGK
ncbi:hypothetical protein ACFL1L_01195 [Thermoplasmatota archaeon]